MEAFLLGAWIVAWDPPPPGTLECFAEVNPFSFALTPEPALLEAHPELNAAALRQARPGARVIPVVVNDVHAGGRARELKSPSALAALLADPGASTAHAAALAAAARPYAGIEVDYERVPDALWEPFTRFLEDLSARLRADGKRLNVDLEPGALRGAARPWLPRIAGVADAVKVMAYYERGGLKASPGPGSSLPWVSGLAREAAEAVPRGKLVVAVSLAATEWTAATPLGPWRARRLHWGRAQRALEASGARVERDAGGAPFARIRGGLRPRELWLEDGAALAAKTEAARAAGAAGAGLWYWGGLHPDLRAAGICPR